jgi:protein TonB
MLAYAPRPQRQRLSPVALSLIVAGHVAVIAAVMSARMVVERHRDPPILIDPIPLPKPPEPVKPQPRTARPATTFDHPDPLTRPPPHPGPSTDPTPQPPLDLGPPIGTGPYADPIPLDPPVVLTGPRFATPEAAIRPPYPIAKRELGEEASLRLRLTIDEHGRVVAVDPVGRADPAFLDAARRHILRAWRYQPAMEGTKAVPSTTTITLKFELGKA